MNNASEHDIDRVLTALRDTEPSAGLEARILHALENRAPARSPWFPRTSAMHWSIAALATAAVILAAALATHNTHRPAPTVAQTWGDPSSPEASSPAKLGPLSPPSSPTQNSVISTEAQPSPSVISTEASRLHATRSGEIAASTEANTPTHPTPAHTPTYPPHQLLCDCDPLALAETQAPSQPPPPMPLTAQERLLQRVVRRDDPIEIAELEPLPNNPLRPAATAKEDDAVKNVVQRYLKQLAAAEALNPTPPTAAPTPTSDSNESGSNADSPNTPN